MPDRPHADHPAKPDSPTELRGPAKGYVVRRGMREFGKDHCTDLAAALTYYAVLALFPATIALLSLVGLVSNPTETVSTLLDVLRRVGAGSAVDTLEPTIRGLATGDSAGFALVTGLALALFSASGYVMSFGRAMNRIYEVEEGRPVWKLRPQMVLLTAVLVVLVAAVLVGLVVSGPVAQAIGGVIGLGDQTLTVWNIAKWPVILAVVVLIVALLYQFTPNVQQPKFRWLSIGAVFAIVVWALASVAFGFYVSNFGSYDKTYGSLAGVVVFLLWLWLTNLALLFGAELDAEIERSRELQAGMAAEESIQLPLRDDRNVKKQEEKEAELVARARALRETRGREGDPDDVDADERATAEERTDVPAQRGSTAEPAKAGRRRR
ncbi:YihY/virulence factor BrkB family protein [Nocardioides perillae]|uniref:Membrane protein n=1 Tax=Nocardioides perillae TaxID=1119534 RepID=A0A7Y9RVF3_9ACTN|nr:membrane protein [Nocardioides perillae]